MESILNMLGIDKDAVFGQLEEFTKRFNKLMELTEKNHVTLIFLAQNLSNEQTEKLNAMLEEVSMKYV